MTRTPYDEGFEARSRDDDCNPYTDLKRRREWLAGWHDQDDHMRAKDEALDSIGWFG